ncbi:MAG TPA: DUF2851 family protein, partial [Nitrolancea sp.]|nr:DUF2851 family protein [Nitrolancea sp.]
MAVDVPDEMLLSQIWNAQWLGGLLRLRDGRELRVVYRGVWTHGLGPDFANAFIDVDGQMLHGAIEIHRRSSDWAVHGHQLDPAYDGVVLHAVWHDDLPGPVRRNDGATIPTLLLPEFLIDSLEQFAANPVLRPLGAIGFDFCAPSSAASNPAALRAVWERSGDERMRLKADAVSARLELEPPAQVLYALLLDALGYTRNRDGMRTLAERLPYDHLDARLIGHPEAERVDRAASLLLGVAGFLPLSPHEEELASLTPDHAVVIGQTWSRLGTAWRGIQVPASRWSLARVRPAAHPIRRLLGFALFLSRLESGLVEGVSAEVSRPEANRALQHWLTYRNPYLGRAHAHEIIVNVIVPFTLAYGDLTNQSNLTERAMALWEELPAGQGNSVITRMVDQVCGGHPQRVTSARAEQGLLHLNSTGCQTMRCFECPIAQLELLSTRSHPN